MKRIAVLAAALVVAAPPARGQEWRYGLQVDASHESNATNGIYDGKKSDNVFAVEGAATRPFLLSERSGLLLRGSARYERYADITGLSNFALTGRAAWRIQPTLGFGTPVYEIAGQIRRLIYPDSDLRDGTLATAEARVGSNLTDRLRISGGFGVDHRNGGNAAGVHVFDYTQHRIFGTFDLGVGLNNTVYGSVTRIGGDQVFSSGSEDGLSTNWADDPALRAPLGLTTANIYRVDAITLASELGINIPFGTDRALDFGLVHYDSKIDQGPEAGERYRAWSVRATFLYHFR